MDDINVYSRECSNGEFLIWFPDGGYRDRWTGDEIKALLARNKAIEAICLRGE